MRRWRTRSFWTRGFGARFHCGDPDGDGGGHHHVLHAELVLFDLEADVLGDVQRVRQLAADQDRDVLVAAEARPCAVRLDAATDDLARFGDAVRTHLVTVLIVDDLETVQVHHRG